VAEVALQITSFPVGAAEIPNANDAKIAKLIRHFPYFMSMHLLDNPFCPNVETLNKPSIHRAVSTTSLHKV
jgi:hypothetical protein